MAGHLDALIGQHGITAACARQRGEVRVALFQKTLRHRQVQLNKGGQPGASRFVSRHFVQAEALQHAEHSRCVEPVTASHPPVHDEHRYRQTVRVQPDGEQVRGVGARPAPRFARQVAPLPTGCGVPEQVQVPVLDCAFAMAVVETLRAVPQVHHIAVRIVLKPAHRCAAREALHQGSADQCAPAARFKFAGGEFLRRAPRQLT